MNETNNMLLHLHKTFFEEITTANIHEVLETYNLFLGSTMVDRCEGRIDHQTLNNDSEKCLVIKTVHKLTVVSN